MSRTLFSARAGRLCQWLGGAALAFGVWAQRTNKADSSDRIEK